MADKPSTYDPGSVTIIVGGIPVQGYADGTFVEIEELGDGFMSQSGADGEVARAVGTDRRHQVTITLLQNSATNDAFSALYNLDRKTGGGGLAPIVITDLSGRSLFAVTWAWIKKMPNAAYGREFNDRAWVFETGEPSVWMLAGNS